MIVIIMGVAGSGKTTVAAMLAAKLGWRFAEGDDFHPAANVAKMRSGRSLDDADRRPWLDAIARQIDAWRTAGQSGVVTCSALKRRYREVLIGRRPGVRLIYLKGDRDLIVQRIAVRRGHFMPAALLDSQFADLEEPGPEEWPIIIAVSDPPAVEVEKIVAALGPH